MCHDDRVEEVSVDAAEHVIPEFERVETAEHVAPDTLWPRVVALERARRRRRELADETLDELAAVKLLAFAGGRADTATERIAAFDEISRRIDVVVRALRGWPAIPARLP